MINTDYIKLENRVKIKSDINRLDRQIIARSDAVGLVRHAARAQSSELFPRAMLVADLPLSKYQVSHPQIKII